VSDELGQSLDRELQRFRSEVESIDDADALYELQVRYVGKKGTITALRQGLGGLPAAERKEFGMRFNAVKDTIEAAIEARKIAIAADARRADLARVVDLTMLSERVPVGSLHPITLTRRHLADVFRSMGFDTEDGPHVEDEQYNFDDLNIPADHPARDMQDTFFVRWPDGSREAGGLVLRTHTSPVQVRTMLRRRPPIRIVAMGTVFRRDDDATHSPMFHQIEGLRVDIGVSMADLKATLFRFVSAFFGTRLEVRFRPSFFPFVEPGAEFDIQCPFCSGRGCGVCKGTGWIELGGAGMVHPNVFKACGIDAETHTGWAFGFGIDRMACLLYGVPDLRLLFDGDVRFLEQFPC
jgi:phenylalanyl-tRNA synthetase alpha chain